MDALMTVPVQTWSDADIAVQRDAVHGVIDHLHAPARDVICHHLHHRCLRCGSAQHFASDATTCAAARAAAETVATAARIGTGGGDAPQVNLAPPTLLSPSSTLLPPPSSPTPPTTTHTLSRSPLPTTTAPIIE